MARAERFQFGCRNDSRGRQSILRTGSAPVFQCSMNFLDRQLNLSLPEAQRILQYILLPHKSHHLILVQVFSLALDMNSDLCENNLPRREHAAHVTDHGIQILHQDHSSLDSNAFNITLLVLLRSALFSLPLCSQQFWRLVTLHAAFSSRLIRWLSE